MLTATSEYAIRALLALARMPQGSLKLGRDLAFEAGIPKNYLPRVLVGLRNAGLVGTARGKGGGYWLLRPADSVHIIEVIELFETVHDNDNCILTHAKSSLSKDGPDGHWQGVRELYLTFLERTTLADISVRDTRPRISRLGRRASAA